MGRCTRGTTRSPARCSFALPRTRWGGAGRAVALGGDYASGSCPASFWGRQNAKLGYAAMAAAGVHGWTEPGLLDELASWQADDLWQYAVYAAIAYIRATAGRTGAQCAMHARNWANALATGGRDAGPSVFLRA